MGPIPQLITGAMLAASAVIAVWMAGAIYYDVCGGAKSGRWVALGWVVGVIALFAAWRPVWQPIAAIVGAETLFLAWWFRQKPSHDRDWEPSAAMLPRAVCAGDVVTIENVRNFDYRLKQRTIVEVRTFSIVTASPSVSGSLAARPR